MAVGHAEQQCSRRSLGFIIRGPRPQSCHCQFRQVRPLSFSLGFHICKQRPAEQCIVTTVPTPCWVMRLCRSRAARGLSGVRITRVRGPAPRPPRPHLHHAHAHTLSCCCRDHCARRVCKEPVLSRWEIGTLGSWSPKWLGKSKRRPQTGKCFLRSTSQRLVTAITVNVGEGGTCLRSLGLGQPHGKFITHGGTRHTVGTVATRDTVGRREDGRVATGAPKSLAWGQGTSRTFHQTGGSEG